MSRTRVFVSYSHTDREWLDRFSLHAAVLERRGLVDLWSDTRIGAGTAWEEEIERALTAAKVAVLLVSPAFLGSKFIWQNEMPRIVAHSEQGMNALPLIIRPCAWKLEEDLARLQARPADGRPLSLGSESQVDLDLSGLIYELAAQIGKSPAALGPSSSDAIAVAADLTGEWTGYYNGTRPIRLLVREVNGRGFSGRMEYSTEGTATNVEGVIYEQWSPSDRFWAQIGGANEGQEVALSFRETGYETKGSSFISFDGEYRTLLRGDEMAGAWFSGDRLVGSLTLTRTRSRPTRGLHRTANAQRASSAR